MTLVCTYLKGLRTARCRSTAIAVSVKMLTLTLSIWTNGQKAHIKCGKFQRCSSAAWNWRNNDVGNNLIRCCIHLKSKKNLLFWYYGIFTLQRTVYLRTYSQLVCVKFAGYNLQASQVTVFIIPDVQTKPTYLFIIYIYTKFHIPSSSISLGITIQTGGVRSGAVSWGTAIHVHGFDSWWRHWDSSLT